MGDKIWINPGKVEEDAAQIGSAAADLTRVPLAFQDMRSTIPANANSKRAYERFQESMSSLGVLLKGEVGNIRGLGAAFIEFDERSI